MNPYPSYKESGIEWIVEIPNHWDIKRIKYTSSFQLSGVDRITSETEINVSICHYPDVYNNESIFRRTKISKGTCTPQELDKFCLKLGDILITKDSESPSDIGVPCYVEENIENTVCGYHLGQYRISDKMSPKYVFRFIQSGFVQSYFETESNGITRFGLGKPSLENLELVIPPLQEQQQISNYLEHKTQQIDSLIEKTQQKIELLKEQRTSLINQVVTKGLNPDVEMKDSGVEWIGEILRGWEVSKFNFYIEIRHGHQFREYDFTDEGIKIIKITQLHKNGYLDISNCSFIDHSRFEEFSEIVIEENDTLMCLTGGTIGKIIRVGKVDEPLLQNYRVGHFSSKDTDKIIDDYIFWIMTSEVINGQIFYEIRETGQPNIGMEDFGKMKICLPSIKEQQQIVDHLDKETIKIDSTIEKETQRIDLLKEYRQSLISEVVTGKVDVRDEVVV